MSSRRNPARPANNVVTAMVVELQRQQQLGGLREVGLIDQQGHLLSRAPRSGDARACHRAGPAR
jgi:phosphoribosyl-dephospho-CoA transferase